MKKLIAVIALVLTVASPAFAAITAVEVVNSDVVFGHTNYTNIDAVLGEIRRDTGGTYVVTPWNCPWTPDAITIISSGTLTVKLSDYIYAADGVNELGIFTAQMFNLRSGSLMNSDMGASISVSENGQDWASLNNGDLTALNTPSLGYQFPDNQWPSSSRYREGPLSDLETTDQYKPFDPSGITDWIDTTAVLEAYGDSAGGNWFDISETGLDRIQYVRLSNIYGNGGYTSGLRLDGFAGASAVPVPSSALLLITGLIGFLGLRKKTNSKCCPATR